MQQIQAINSLSYSVTWYKTKAKKVISAVLQKCNGEAIQ